MAPWGGRIAAVKDKTSHRFSFFEKVHYLLPFLLYSFLAILPLSRYIESMKRTILAPLLSALVLPGLGQVVNGQVRKAGLMIAAVSLLFLALFFKVLYDLNRVFLSRPLDTAGDRPLTLPQVAQALSGQDRTLLFILLFLLFGIWIYGVWDAFRVARKSEANKSSCGNF